MPGRWLHHHGRLWPVLAALLALACWGAPASTAEAACDAAPPELVFATACSVQRMDMPRATRFWRKGMPAVFVVDAPDVPALLLEEGRRYILHVQRATGCTRRPGAYVGRARAQPRSCIRIGLASAAGWTLPAAHGAPRLCRWSMADGYTCQVPGISAVRSTHCGLSAAMGSMYSLWATTDLM